MQTSRSRRFAQFFQFAEGITVERYLTPRMQEVGRLLSRGKSLVEVANVFSVTRERIRQISNKINYRIRRLEKEKQSQKKKVAKKTKLRDMDNKQLVREYTCSVRHTWGEKRKLGENPAHNSSYQRELSIKRELLRRLSQQS